MHKCWKLNAEAAPDAGGLYCLLASCWEGLQYQKSVERLASATAVELTSVKWAECPPGVELLSRLISHRVFYTRSVESCSMQTHA